MSAALVASAHKTVHISLSRDEADGAILIERAFAGISSGNFAMFAAILRASSFASSLAADSPVASPLGTVTDERHSKAAGENGAKPAALPQCP